MSLASQRFGRKLGRRTHNRFVVRGAAVSWVLNGQRPFPDETLPLSDISRGGLSFLTNDPPTAGSEIVLLILLPNKTDTLELLGKVVYSISRGPRLTYGYRVGVEFKPFAESAGCNSRGALDVIEALERRHG